MVRGEGEYPGEIKELFLSLCKEDPLIDTIAPTAALSDHQFGRVVMESFSHQTWRILVLLAA